MKKKTSIVLFMLAGILMADFTSKFQDARKRMNQKKYAEADRLFDKLSETAPRPALKDQCNSLSAEALAMQGKHAEAEEKAARIQDRALKNLTLMKILMQQKKYSDLLEKYGNEDFSQYPDSIAAGAYEIRGTAGLNSKTTRDTGIRDLYSAAELITGNDLKKDSILGKIMENSYWRKDSKNLRKSAELILAGKPFPSWGTWLTAHLYLAELEIGEGALDQALKHADAISSRNDTYGAWKYRVRGDVFLKQGKKDEAIAEWKKGVEIKGYMKKSLQSRLDKAGK